MPAQTFLLLVLLAHRAWLRLFYSNTLYKFSYLLTYINANYEKLQTELLIQTANIYSVSQKNPPPLRIVAIFPKRLGIFQPYFTCLLRVPIYARLQIFIQLPATLTKLSHI